MVPGNAPKVILEASRRSVIRPGIFGDHLWRHCQGAPKIELFGTKSHQNLKKWGPEWGIKRYMKFWLKFYEEMWDFGCAESAEMLCLKPFWWLTHIMTKSRISFKTQSVTAAPQDFRPFQVRWLMCGLLAFCGLWPIQCATLAEIGDAAITVLSNFGTEKLKHFD